MGTNRTHRSHARCHPYSIPQPVKVGHTTRVYVPYSFRIMVWVLLHPTRTDQWECCETVPLHLFEKTRKSNHLQMSLQRQHFLLSFLKTLSVGPAVVWTHDLPLSRLVLSQLSSPGEGYWANLPLSQVGQQISWIELCICYLVWN